MAPPNRPNRPDPIPLRTTASRPRVHRMGGESSGGGRPPLLGPGAVAGGTGNNRRRMIGFGLVILLALTLSIVFGPATDDVEELTYSALLTAVEDGDVESVTIGADGRIEGTYGDGDAFTSTAPTAVEDTNLIGELRAADVEIDARPPQGGGWVALVVNLLPFLLIGGFLFWMFRRARGQMGQMSQIGKSKAKDVSQERPDTRFSDIAGYDPAKQEIAEVVDYLRDPSRFAELGARGPGGLLLVGPPGTGKTLFARAVAGEAQVPFFSSAGSEFVEMIVGVGASRVRDLFEKAREAAPAIVFIDELDSIGRRRGSQSSIGSNNEQEQTLNQLLSELDGFDPREGVVVMAATNRAELLDNALTRPGRFDREIEIPHPDLSERVAILELHAGDKKTADDIDLRRLARGTPGFSGAELENLLNEAAFHAARAERPSITQEDLDAARDRLILGRRQDSSVLREDERQRVAFHEAGHALTAALSEHADPVAKITILPTRRALGVTEQLPLDERRLYPEGYLTDLLTIRLGGRVAELTALGTASSGAANDLAGATHIATRMVRDFGLSEAVGPVGYASADSGGEGVPPGMRERPYAQQTQRLIDEEVARLLRDAEKRATSLLEEHRDELDALAGRLLDEETVDGEVVYALVGRERPT